MNNLQRAFVALATFVVLAFGGKALAQAVGNSNGATGATGATGNGNGVARGGSAVGNNGFNNGGVATRGALAYATAVAADNPYLYYKMNSTTATETDHGSGGNNGTYQGTGLQNQVALIQDSDAASYTSQNGASNGLLKTEPLTSWPTATVTTWEIWIQPNATDCPGIGGGLQLAVSDWGPSSGGPFAIGVQNDSSSCHVIVEGDNGNVSAAGANGDMLPGVTYMVDFTYDTTHGIQVYVDGNSTPVATNASTYYPAWTTTFAGPVGVGQPLSRTTVNTFNGGAGFNGLISDFSMYTTELSTTRMLAHYEAGVVQPPPTPTPFPTIAGFAADLERCINNKVNITILPTVAPGFGSASGHTVGEFELSGYVRSVYDTYWGTGTTSQRIGTVGAQYQTQAPASHNTLTAAVTIPAYNGSVSISVTTASPAGMANGNTVQIGVAPYNYTSGVLNTATQDPTQLICTLNSGYGTTTWNMTGCRPFYRHDPPVLTATTIPLTSPAYGTATKIFKITSYATWNGGKLSFGPINGPYDTYATITGDGFAGVVAGWSDPFTITTDSGVTGSPQGMRIAAYPAPTGVEFPNSSTSNIGNTYQATTFNGSSTSWPAQGSNITITVANPASAQNNWLVSIGNRGSGQVFLGVLASGGCDHNAGCAGTPTPGPWTIAFGNYAEGSQSGTFSSGQAIGVWTYAGFLSGTIDKELDLQYGYLEANLRAAPMQAANSNAFWTLQSQAGSNAICSQGGPTRHEVDIFEQFSSVLGATHANMGNLLYDQDLNCSTAAWFSGTYALPGAINPSTSYNLYGANFAAGGQPTPFPTPVPTPGTVGAPFVTNFSSAQGTTGYFNGIPLFDHTGAIDLTQGVAGKEMMATYQIGNPYGFLAPPANADTTSSSFVVPAADYGAEVNVPLTNIAGWTPIPGREVDIVNSTSSPTIYMHCMIMSIGASSLTCATMYGSGGGTSGCTGGTLGPLCLQGTSTTGSTMPSGSTVIAVDGSMAYTYPQYFWVQWIRAYAPTGASC